MVVTDCFAPILRLPVPGLVQKDFPLRDRGGICPPLLTPVLRLPLLHPILQTSARVLPWAVFDSGDQVAYVRGFSPRLRRSRLACQGVRAASREGLTAWVSSVLTGLINMWAL